MALRCIWRIYNPSPEYQPEAEPRADIEGRGLYIRHIHREDMVYIIYSIVKRKIKAQLWRHSAQYSAAAPSYCLPSSFLQRQ